MAPLLSVQNLATKWRHLHELQILPPCQPPCPAPTSLPLTSSPYVSKIARVTPTNSSSYIHHHISLLVNLHVGHLIDHLVNLHDQHHNLSNITSISIINYQSLSVKSSVGIFTHQGHISQVGSTVSLTDSLTHSLTNITSRASCDAKKKLNFMF